MHVIVCCSKPCFHRLKSTNNALKIRPPLRLISIIVYLTVNRSEINKANNNELKGIKIKRTLSLKCKLFIFIIIVINIINRFKIL